MLHPSYNFYIGEQTVLIFLFLHLETMPKCLACDRAFKNGRGLAQHLQKQNECFDYVNNNINLEHQSNKRFKTTHQNNSQDDTYFNIDHDIEGNQSINQHNESSFIENDCLLEMYMKYNSSGYRFAIDNEGVYKACIELLYILKKSNAPLYLYDLIVQWAKKATATYQVNFTMNCIPSRSQIIESCKKQFDLKRIEPFEKPTCLRGSNTIIKIVVHDFMSSLYSLLIDEKLMNRNNLLLSDDLLDGLNKKQTKVNNRVHLNDINTGSVYKLGVKSFISDSEKQLLCPIIFFIDKTHTDINGRLCLEQVRFTLGIFNKKTRNDPRAWRTLGYIKDQAHISTSNSLQKSQDYHHMLEVVLEEFTQCQKFSYLWDLKIDEMTIKRVSLILPVLFIVGDTDGHDKLAGRYTSRTNVARLCRYCDCPFDSSDDPEYAFKYLKHDATFEFIEGASQLELKAVSMHPTINAFKQVLFCDQERGLFGSLCADIMHCLQHGLYIYIIEVLCDQKN
jgi:hypothetical protein